MSKELKKGYASSKQVGATKLVAAHAALEKAWYLKWQAEQKVIASSLTKQSSDRRKSKKS